jgi:protein SCO1
MIGRFVAATAILMAAAFAQTAHRYPVTGLILKADPAHRSFVASCTAIPEYMEAMVMTYSVRDASQLKGIEPSLLVDFTLVVTENDSYAEDIRIHRYASMDAEPVEVRSLQLLGGTVPAGPATPSLALGDAVPDFTLTDQARQRISLSQFAGKIVVAAFIYTSCPLPNYCLRLSNNLGSLKSRFAGALGRDLILLNVTMDPVHDSPEVLATYAARWKADPRSWHFLTGSRQDIAEIGHRFGVDFWLGEGSLTHSLHTVVIDRRRRLAANFEGNEFSAQELGDFVEAMLHEDQ